MIADTVLNLTYLANEHDTRLTSTSDKFKKSGNKVPYIFGKSLGTQHHK